MPPTSTPTDDIPVTVRQHDRERKEKIKCYADDHNRASLSDVKKGDTVLLRQPRQTKLSTTYDPKPYIVEEKKGLSVLLKRPFERQIMRNESMIRKIPDGKDDADAKKRGLQNCGQQVSEEKKHEKQNEVSIRPKRAR